jgi:hypothetical protein
MARYNTIRSTALTTTTATLAAPEVGLFTQLTGTAPYTVTLPNPVLFSGQGQMFQNATSGVVTLSTPSGIFIGPTATNLSTMPLQAGIMVSVISNGTDYVISNNLGGALQAASTVTLSPANANVTISPSGTGSLTINPAAASTINNTSIGASSRSTGAFTTLTSNGATTFTVNTASTGTSSGALVVSGGVGIAGNLYSGGTAAQLGTSTASATTATIGGAISGNILKITSTASGTISVTTDVTTGIANLFQSLTTGTLNIGSTAAGRLAVAFNQASSGTTSGALTVAGGVGVGGTLHAGNITTSGTLTSSGTTTVTGTFTFGGSAVVTTATRPALGTNGIIRTNAQTIGESITIPAGTAGVTAGPVTIASGQTITVNGDWSIV